MAPSANTEPSSAPLADYFFISGIETSQVYDKQAQANGTPSPALDVTIEEDVRGESEGRSPTSPVASDSFSPSAFENSWSARREARKSISSIVGGEDRFTASNRSSATVKGLATALGGSGLSDADFDDALKKFASERDTFLEEIQFSTGSMTTPKPSAPKPRPKTQVQPQPQPQTSSKEESSIGSNIRSGVGTLKRRISTMSSMKRQPSVIRQCESRSSRGSYADGAFRRSTYGADVPPASIRTSRRLSGYNAVIPAPQPFHPDPTMHPLRRRYEPVLLDRYPPVTMVDQLKRRNPFPDYVPMFAFPDDVRVVMADERPKSTWHGFSMTNGDGSKLHGICLVVWVPLNTEAATELEKQCDAWRRANVSSEERELASSLGERLAAERAKLSRLLAQLPSTLSGSDERESLEEEICAVEEKIALMNDLLRTFRYGASAKIEGLTDGETGLWIPRAYGVLGRDGGMTSFWKEWLKAVVVPMMNGAILRVPPSSPKIGMWQPLERYVVNLCAEAVSPISSLTQVELSIRELRLYARKEATNELPGSRNIDLYALFRSLTIPNIVTLFEYALAEARIILLSSHTSMLHLASAALVNLLYPIKWTGVFIPVLPARLVQAIEAPCPYIVGIDRRYENWELPDDDYVLVDLDNDTIESTTEPIPLPRQQRRKLTALLQLAAPHHYRYGVPVGPPAYAQEAFPYEGFPAENPSIFTARTTPSTLATCVSLNSTSFGTGYPGSGGSEPIFNAFLRSRNDRSRGSDRPSTSSTIKTNVSPPSPRYSPTSTVFPPLPLTPISRSDSGYALQGALREKRSAHFDTTSRRSSSFTFDRVPTTRRPSQPLAGHHSNLSVSTLGAEFRAASTYAPSVYAQSTLAASTIMPGVVMNPVRNTENTKWIEGHCLHWRPLEDKSSCSICDEKSDDGLYRCSGMFNLDFFFVFLLSRAYPNHEHRMWHVHARPMLRGDLHRLPDGLPP